MIKFKSGVLIHPESCHMPEVMRILHIASVVAPVDYNVTVTSGCDGDHIEGSAHYAGKAFDLRTRDFIGSVQMWSKRIKQALGSCYFILIESDHIHIQWNG